MSKEYDAYLLRHVSNVREGYWWLERYMPMLFEDQIENVFEHDKSKREADEYEAYDAYFYGGNKTPAVIDAYMRAWNLHIHRNPHHWQHWVLINDDPAEGEICLDMPYKYIVEMICDWWAFSWQKGDLSEIFEWYAKHASYIKLSPRTREKVEFILQKIRTELEKDWRKEHRNE